MTQSIRGGSIVLLIGVSTILSVVAFWYWALFVHGSLVEVVASSYGGSAAAQEEKIRAMRKEVRDTAQSRAALRTLAITEDEVPTFLNELESLGTEAAPVFVRGVSMQSDAGLVSVTLTFSGSFTQVTSIIEHINKVRYASYIDTLEIRTSKTLGGGSEQDVSMRFMVPLLAHDDI